MIIVIGINLIIGYVVIHKTGFDNRLGGTHILVSDINVLLIGRKHGFNAAADINTPADILRALDINISGVAVVVLYAEKCGIGKRQNQHEYYKEHRLARSFGPHWQILHYMRYLSIIHKKPADVNH